MISLVKTNSVDFEQSVHQIQESERKRIAQELHDEIGQFLTAIHLDASAIIEAGEISYAHDIAADIDKTALQVMDRVKTILHQLKPLNDPDISFEKTIKNLISSWQTHSREALVSVNVEGEFSGVSELILKTIYRVTQEALTNISRHAVAQNVLINIARQGDRIFLSIQDDGIGFEQKVVIKGFGLIGMQERVADVSGSFDITTSPEQGVMLSVSIPC